MAHHRSWLSCAWATLSPEQATGRPFGNVELALLATERAAEVTRLSGPDRFSHWQQV